MASRTSPHPDSRVKLRRRLALAAGDLGTARDSHAFGLRDLKAGGGIRDGDPGLGRGASERRKGNLPLTCTRSRTLGRVAFLERRLLAAAAFGAGARREERRLRAAAAFGAGAGREERRLRAAAAFGAGAGREERLRRPLDLGRSPRNGLRPPSMPTNETRSANHSATRRNWYAPFVAPQTCLPSASKPRSQVSSPFSRRTTSLVA